MTVTAQNLTRDITKGDVSENKKILPFLKGKNKLIEKHSACNTEEVDSTSEEEDAAVRPAKSLSRKNDKDNNASKSGFLKNIMAKARHGATTAISGATAGVSRKASGGTTTARKLGTGAGLRGVGGRIKRSFSRKNMIQQALNDAMNVDEEISSSGAGAPPPPLSTPTTKSPSLVPSICSSKKTSSKTGSKSPKNSTKKNSEKNPKKKESSGSSSPKTTTTKKGTKKVAKKSDEESTSTNKEDKKKEHVQEEKSQPSSLKSSSSSSSSGVDYEMIQFKLEQANDRMDTMMREQGENVFASEDFVLLLEERDEYMEQLEKAPVQPQKKGIITPIVSKSNDDESSSPKFREMTASESFDGTRRRSLGPKRRSTKVCAPRLQELDNVYVPKSFEKTPEDMQLLRTTLSKNFLFKKLTDKAIEQMVAAFEPQDHFQKGDVIIQQSESFGEYFYVLGHGSVVFEVNGKSVGGTDVPGAPFGELALLYQSARKATVRSDSDKIRLYRVDQVTFRYILQSRSKFKTLGMQAVTKVKAMNRLLKLVDLTAIKEMDDDDENVQSSNKKNGSEGLCGGNATKMSGISSLLDTSARSRLSNSSRRGFEYDDNAEDDFLDHSERRMSIRSSMMSVRSVSVNSFQRNSVLGEGQFGEVWLVQPSIDVIKESQNEVENLDEEKFALKIQSKDCMNRASSDYSVADAVKRECDVLSSLCHPFIVDFVRSFEDEDNIYMVMGAIHGKELWDYIHREQDDGEWVSGIPEDHAKFYTLLIGDTLNFMHRQLICHRDIKPENVMINQAGYPVLVDFGFAKQLPENDTTYTLCGTPKYTAPEIIGNEGHGCAVDNWALGVVLYEMISGENPFWYDGIDDLQLLDDICNQKPYPIQDDADCTEGCRDLIMKLLEKDPAKRLVGTELTSDPWFDGLDIHLARRSELPAPWLPVSFSS